MFYERSRDGGTNGLNLDYNNGKWLGNDQDQYEVEVERLDNYKPNECRIYKNRCRRL